MSNIGLMSNWDFGWELVLQVEMIFIRWDLKTHSIKRSEYKSQTKKMISIVISTFLTFDLPP